MVHVFKKSIANIPTNFITHETIIFDDTISHIQKKIETICRKNHFPIRSKVGLKKLCLALSRKYSRLNKPLASPLLMNALYYQMINQLINIFNKIHR